MSLLANIGIMSSQSATPTIYTYNPKVVWDLTDITTLFQDSAGTVPVTTDGDPVGLMLNKINSYPAADMLQTSAGARPIYRTSGGKVWLESNGTKWFQSRNVDALAFSIVNIFTGFRKTTGFVDYGIFVCHPHAATHTSPFVRWVQQGRAPGSGFTVGFASPSGFTRQDLNVAAADVGLDFIYTLGANDMWNTATSNQRADVARINKILVSTVSTPNTISYPNSNVSTVFSGAAGADLCVGDFYGAVLYDTPVTTQTQIDIAEAWINDKLRVPV